MPAPTRAVLGLGSCVGTAPIDTSIDTSTVGSHTFTVTATDGADNAASVSRRYDVNYFVHRFLQSHRRTSDR